MEELGQKVVAHAVAGRWNQVAEEVAGVFPIVKNDEIYGQTWTWLFNQPNASLIVS